MSGDIAGGLLADSFGWDVENWSRSIEFWRARSRLSLEGARVLEVGATTTAGLSLWFAAAGADVVCSGLEQPAAESARLHAEYGVAKRVSYRRLDVLELDDVAAFDIIAMKSVLGGIGSWSGVLGQHQALDNILRALVPGGELWMAENGSATALHRYLRDRFGWGKDGSGWRYLRPQDLPRLIRGYESWDWSSAGTLGVLGRSEQQRRVLSRVDKLIDPLVPARRRYVLFVHARKSEA